MYSEDMKTLALKLYFKLNSLRKVSKITDINFSTISRWKNFKPSFRKRTIKKLDSSDIVDSMNLYILSHPFCSIKDIKDIIKDTHKINVSLELVRLFMIRNNFTKKRVRYYSKPKNDEEKLKEFLKKREEFVKENRVFVSIDETSFGRNYLSAFGYSKKGERLYVKRPFNNITTQSVLSAVSIGNPIVYFKKTGSFNSQSFYDFLRSLNLPHKTVLLMDNVSFHHSKIIKDFASHNNLDILYTVPYSPIFNPIEGVFSIVKRHYQKFMSIEKSFSSVTPEHIKSFFKYSFNAISRF